MCVSLRCRSTQRIGRAKVVGIGTEASHWSLVEAVGTILVGSRVVGLVRVVVTVGTVVVVTIVRNRTALGARVARLIT